jgi:FkbM family methyltransferase
MQRLIVTCREHEHLISALDFMGFVDGLNISDSLAAVKDAKGQFHQDLFVLVTLGFKKLGYFVEFGATNGVTHSNTWLLEHKFGWNGIVAEPDRRWSEQLAASRSCHICYDCVWKTSGQRLVFNEAPFAGLSTLDTFSGLDRHASKRQSGKKYLVETISLNELLSRYGAPRKIDYLSVDTEGSEFEILSELDFDHWDISILTVEHNQTAQRKKLQKLLTGQGYSRVLTSLSDADDWYVRNHLRETVIKKFGSRA